MSPAFAPILSSTGLILATAFGYAVATIGMKSASGGTVIFGITLAALGFGVAFLAEIVLLRRSDLSVIYITIVAAETFLVLGYAIWIGEGLGLKQAFGAALVLVGLLAIST